MAVYYFLFFFLFLSGYFCCERHRCRKWTIVFLILNGIFFVMTASLRYAIGFDYFPYETLFYSIKQNSIKDIVFLYQKEWGFYFLNKIVSFLGGEYLLFLFVSNIFITSLVFYFIYKHSPIPWMSLFLYLSFQFFAQSMNLLRQSMAISIFLFAYRPLQQKKFWNYAGIVLAASFFHKTALILLPFYFILTYSFSKKEFFLLVSLFLILYFSFDTLFSFLITRFLKEYAFYMNSIYWTGNSFQYAILPCLYFFFVLYSRKQNIKNTVLINSGLFASFFSFLITKHFILERLSGYFFIFSILLVPQTILTKNLDNPFPLLKNKLSVLTILIGFGYFFFAASKGFHHIYPYFSIFDRIKL